MATLKRTLTEILAAPPRSYEQALAERKAKLDAIAAEQRVRDHETFGTLQGAARAVGFSVAFYAFAGTLFMWGS